MNQQELFRFASMSPAEIRDERDQHPLLLEKPRRKVVAEMVIERRYRGDPEWEEVSEDELIQRCEWGGSWRKGSALKTLREAGKISTPWADFRIREVNT
jgi:hypothetical protein